MKICVFLDVENPSWDVSWLRSGGLISLSDAHGHKLHGLVERVHTDDREFTEGREPAGTATGDTSHEFAPQDDAADSHKHGGRGLLHVGAGHAATGDGHDHPGD